jgi:hypothetical protein
MLTSLVSRFAVVYFSEAHMNYLTVLFMQHAVEKRVLRRRVHAGSSVKSNASSAAPRAAQQHAAAPDSEYGRILFTWQAKTLTDLLLVCLPT